jgi:dTDP-4-amino-4,6-dideoxygalactose transaminase
MKVPFVDLSSVHQPIMDELDEAIRNVIGKSDFILGEEVTCFEEEFASYCEAEHAVGVDCGLSALELILRGYGIGKGDEVIVPAFTFIATAAAVSFAGAEPVFVDVDPFTYCIDVAQAEAAVTARTRAIIPVHLYGQPADMDEINRLAEEHDLVVIEDACQAHGAIYKGRKTGSLGDAAAFSFYPSKNLGGFGDGGMAVTGDPSVADKMRAMRNCGQRTKNTHELMPFNHRLDTLQAAVLRIKLRHLNRWNDSRRQVASRYDELLEKANVVPPMASLDTSHAYHVYVIRSSNRDALQAKLRDRGIGTAVHYPTPVHLQPIYADRGHHLGDFPVAERLASEVLSLPMYPFMPDDHVRLVAARIAAFGEMPVVGDEHLAPGYTVLGTGHTWKTGA